MPVNPKRVRTFSDGEEKKGPVVYWMSRDQRARDNWALIYAQELAQKRDSALVVAFCLAPEFLGATRRQYSFMLQGLREVEQSLRALNIPFFLRQGDPGHEIPDLLSELDAGALVSDFSPLRQSLEWKTAVADEIRLPFYEVDAHNIIPCWFASAQTRVGRLQLPAKGPPSPFRVPGGVPGNASKSFAAGKTSLKTIGMLCRGASKPTTFPM